MSYLKLIPLMAVLLANLVAARASEYPTLLQDFDHESAGDFEQLEPCDIADFDNDGDREARFTASGRKAIFRLKLKRSGQLLKRVMSGDRPVFCFDVTLPEGFAPSTPVQVQIFVQTDVVKADERDVYGRVVIKNKVGLVEKATHQVAVDLSKVTLTTRGSRCLS
jgi:hypothetical protein